MLLFGLLGALGGWRSHSHAMLEAAAVTEKDAMLEAAAVTEKAFFFFENHTVQAQIAEAFMKRDAIACSTDTAPCALYDTVVGNQSLCANHVCVDYTAPFDSICFVDGKYTWVHFDTYGCEALSVADISRIAMEADMSNAAQLAEVTTCLTQCQCFFSTAGIPMSWGVQDNAKFIARTLNRQHNADVLVWGDSITDNLATKDANAGVRGRLAALLERDITFMGVHGIDWRESIQRIWLLRRAMPRTLYFWLGINDLLHNVNLPATLQYMKFTLAYVRATTNASVVVQTILPAYLEAGALNASTANELGSNTVHKYAVHALVGAFNEQLRAWARDEGLKLHDAHATFARYLEHGGNASALYDSDGLHLSTAGYELWLSSFDRHSLDA